MTTEYLRPNGDGTFTDWTGAYSNLDEDPDTPDDNDFGRSYGASTAFYTLTDLPAGDITSIDTITIKVRSKGTDGQRVAIYAQLYESDEITALTNEVLVRRHTSSSWATDNIELPLIGSPTKSQIDGSRIRIRSEKVPLWPYRWEIGGFTEFDVASGAVWANGSASAGVGGAGGTNDSSTADDGDSVSYWFPLDYGTYQFGLIYGKTSDSGIVDISLNDTNISTIDMYASSGLVNQLASATEIVISTPGIQTLTITANGKNASSSDYEFNIHYLALVRTGA